MKRKRTGSFITISTVGEKVRAFVPDTLPPTEPLRITPALQADIDRTHLALGRLDSAASLLPDIKLLLYAYIRKEAVLSSKIEGTQSSLSDLLLFELDGTPGVPIDDVTEVSNYVAALTHGMKRIREGFPISIRLLKEMHAILLAKGRGNDRTPGEIRTSQNWVGGSRPGTAVFVPPPSSQVPECLGELEMFLNNERGAVSPLIKAALAHVQFETIHPFLDGNGRLGRLLITLIFCNEKVLAEPMLYLSLYFKNNRAEYYDLLQRVRTEGDWEAWIAFFAKAVCTTAEQAVSTAQRLSRLAENDRERIRSFGRMAGTALMVHHVLMERPLVSSKSVCARTRLVPNTVNKVLRMLTEEAIVKETTGKGRDRVFAYTGYIDIMNEGIE